jgi:hypothetical protein
MSDVDPSHPFDERRQAIYDALNAQNPEYAGYYRVGIAALLTPAPTADQRAKVSVVCHAFREIVNGLWAAIGESRSQPIDPSSVQLLSELPEFRINLDEFEGEELVVVPLAREAAEKLDELLATAGLEHSQDAEDIGSMLAGMKQEGHVLLSTWRRCQRFFVKWSHWDRGGRTKPVPSDADLELHVREIEEIIAARAGAFFHAVHAIEDLIADANRTEEAR